MKIRILLLSFVTVAAFIILTFNKAIPKPPDMVREDNTVKRLDRVGETITYKVKLGKVSLGRAIYKHLPREEFEGKEVNTTVFETKAAGFYDLEKIYSDIVSFLPLKVERSVATWTSSEKITEFYDQKDFVLTIKKLKSRKETVTRIRKDGVINNAILLPYYVRDLRKLELGYKLDVELPTQKIALELTDKQEIRVPAGKFLAYHFISKPRKIEIWITADERRIPIKIEGSGALGYTLLMQRYELIK